MYLESGHIQRDGHLSIAVAAFLADDCDTRLAESYATLQHRNDENQSIHPTNQDILDFQPFPNLFFKTNLALLLSAFQQGQRSAWGAAGCGRTAPALPAARTVDWPADAPAGSLSSPIMPWEWAGAHAVLPVRTDAPWAEGQEVTNTLFLSLRRIGSATIHPNCRFAYQKNRPSGLRFVRLDWKWIHCDQWWRKNSFCIKHS